MDGEKILLNMGDLQSSLDRQRGLTQAAGQVGPSNVLRLGRDHEEIASWEMPREATEEHVLWMENISYENVRPAICTRPPRKPTQIASHAELSHVQISCL